MGRNKSATHGQVSGLLGDGEGFDLGLDLDDLDEPRQPQRRRENRGAEDQFGSNMDGDETMEVEIGLDTPGAVDRRSAQDLIAPDLGAVGEDTSLDKTFELNNRDGDLSLGVENGNINFEKSRPAAPIGVCKEFAGSVQVPYRWEADESDQRLKEEGEGRL
ncbi:hypothetical protein PPACK8108_LOCUS3465 [Phakopsora pachyrhizi]|uniref:Uncharacterized protein n=1 Tax=Phakopsora pachyrhizi TaxID=170000 RepID=A0AAV0AMT2_PHAPC|nr:hypothetical protein PPACK8108_LOCUS3465 [Phakopsora pachyrhizi]